MVISHGFFRNGFDSKQEQLMTDKRFVAFCNHRARVIAEYDSASYYINALVGDDKQRIVWLEFVGLIETAYLIWYYEYTNDTSN